MFHLVTTRFRDNRLQPIVLPPYVWQAQPFPMWRGTMARSATVLGLQENGT